MSETIGGLVDKLGIVNLKMWWAQEKLYEVRRLDFEAFKSRFGDEKGLRELFDSFKSACDLNLQRNDIIDEIDRAIDAAIKVGAAPVAAKHKSY